jgi:hypothetical protein
VVAARTEALRLAGRTRRTGTQPPGTSLTSRGFAQDRPGELASHVTGAMPNDGMAMADEVEALGGWAGKGQGRPAHGRLPPVIDEGQAPTWALYCDDGKGCNAARCWAQVKKDYHEHNRVSLLCYLVEYFVGCIVLSGIVGFMVWMGSELW